MKRILILFLLTLSLGTVNATENTVKPFTESCVKIGYKLDEFSPSKPEKKVEKKDNKGEEKSEGLTEEEKKKINDSLKYLGMSFVEAFMICLVCIIFCAVITIVYMAVLRITIILQHKYAKKS
jgi:hypothetical protein